MSDNDKFDLQINEDGSNITHVHSRISNLESAMLKMSDGDTFDLEINEDGSNIAHVHSHIPNLALIWAKLSNMKKLEPQVDHEDGVSIKPDPPSPRASLNNTRCVSSIEPTKSDSGVCSHADENVFVDEIDACNPEVKRYLIECQCYEADLDLETSCGITETNEEILRASIAYIDDIRNKFITAHDNMMNLLGMEETSSTRLAMAKRSRFLSTYRSFKKALFKAIRPAPEVNTVRDTTSLDAADNDEGGPKVLDVEDRHPNVTADATINLPEFDGDCQEWIEWKNQYTSLIHNRESLNDFEKYKILRSKLKGEAHGLLAAIPIQAQFYQPAWDLVCETFGDPVKNLHRCLHSLEAVAPVPPASSSNCRALLKSLINRFKAGVTFIQKMVADNPNLNVLEPLLIYFFLSKTDADTRAAWYSEVARWKFETPPRLPTTFQELIEFMDMRCVSLEPAKSVKRRATEGPLYSVLEKRKCINGNRCGCCWANDHGTQECKVLLDKDPSERLKFAKVRNWCFRCLNPLAQCAGLCDIRCGICGSKGHGSVMHHCWWK